jgi:DNA-binding response OmpR family regulator
MKGTWKMTSTMSTQPEAVVQLQEIHVKRQRILKKLAKLNDREATLFMQLQVQENGKTIAPPDFSVFKGTTRQLLTKFWNAPDHILSHEDIRQDVIFDEEAKDCTVWQTVSRANAELIKMKFPFEIKNIRKKRYQLAPNSLTKSDKSSRCYKYYEKICHDLSGIHGTMAVVL